VPWDGIERTPYLGAPRPRAGHGHPITSGIRGIGRPRIDLPGPTGGQHDCASREHELATRPFIQHNGPAAISGIDHEIHRKVVIQSLNTFLPIHLSNQDSYHLIPRRIPARAQNAASTVSCLPGKRELAADFVELGPPPDQFLNPLGPSSTRPAPLVSDRAHAPL
jgi:hypothetical protein